MGLHKQCSLCDKVKLLSLLAFGLRHFLFCRLHVCVVYCVCKERNDVCIENGGHCTKGIYNNYKIYMFVVHVDCYMFCLLLLFTITKLYGHC